MCRLCENIALSTKTFSEFKSSAIKSASNYESLGSFLSQAKGVDKLRFDTGDEWGEPKILQSVSRLIFANPNPDEGLLLFTLGCWLDMQAQYTVVWNNYLKQAKNWMEGRGAVPRGGFQPTTKHLLLTRNSINKNCTISAWFSQKINQIANTHGKKMGNIYRLAGEICNDLYSKPEVVAQLRNGTLPKQFSGGDHKRFWMFLMFLRRDNSIMKCLFTRALGNVDGGKQAIAYWFNDQYFNSLECELPVDIWVRTNWNKMTNRLNLPSFASENTSQVAAKARELALKVNMSPSALDAILFYS